MSSRLQTEPPPVAAELVKQVREELLAPLGEASRKGYNSDLRQFTRNGDQALGELLALSQEEASERVLQWLQTSKISPATQRRRLSTLRQFVEVARRRGIIDWQLAGVQSPREAKYATCPNCLERLLVQGGYRGEEFFLAPAGMGI